MRQGCPLSTLLSVLAIEPLAHLILNNPNVKGTEVAGTAHKLRMFAANVLLFVTSPRISTPNLLSLLDYFAKISGLKVNQTKSRALNITLSAEECRHLRLSLPMVIAFFEIPRSAPDHPP